MARQNINLGVNPNDGTGDNLRDAMLKVNQNLIELYTRTGGDANISNTGIKINGNVLGMAGDITISTQNSGGVSFLAPTYFQDDMYIYNGILRINTNEVDPQNIAIINGNTKIKGSTTIGDNNLFDKIFLNSTITGTIAPSETITYDLGTTSLRYNNAYIGGLLDSTNFYTAGANINGGTINNTTIGSSIPSEGRFSILRSVGDSFLGDLLVRDRGITTSVINGDIEFRPNGAGNVYVSTKMIVGSGSTPMVNPVLQATGNADNFSQIGVQNTNNGKFACSDIVVFTNDGSDFFNFADIGQNNSGWDGSLQYVYFDQTSAANTWVVGDTLVQYDLLDGSSILARGQIDEIIANPLNSNELRMRVCNVFEGTTGIFDQGSIHGNVLNETRSTSATPKEHLVETFTATGVATYNIGSGSLNGSTARAAFAPTVVLASDSVEVKVNGVIQHAGVDFVIQFNKIKFRTVPSPGSIVTIRQYPDGNYPFTVGQSGDSYVYNNGSKLTLGTMTGHDLLFHVNGVRYTSEAGRIKGDTKNWILGNGVTSKDGFPDTGELLQVKGDTRIDGNLIIEQRSISNMIGVPGDKAGMLCFDELFIYTCSANYDGTNIIWKKLDINALSLGAAGTGGQIQYSNNGAFAADTSFTFDSVQKKLKVQGPIVSGEYVQSSSIDKLGIQVLSTFDDPNSTASANLEANLANNILTLSQYSEDSPLGPHVLESGSIDATGFYLFKEDTVNNVNVDITLKLPSLPADSTVVYSLALPTSSGDNGQLLTSDGNGNLVWTYPISAATGVTTELQYNNNGFLDGSTTLTVVNDDDNHKAILATGQIGSSSDTNTTILSKGGLTSTTYFTGVQNYRTELSPGTILTRALQTVATLNDSGLHVENEAGAVPYYANYEYDGIIINRGNYNSKITVAVGNPSQFDVTFTLPNSGGNVGETLVSDGFGTLDWATPLVQTSAPSSSIGAEGDRSGLTAWDSNYVYICTGSYDGSTNIWRRIANTPSSW